MKLFILTIILLISSIIDIKTRNVYLINNLIILILALFNINNDLIDHLLALVIPSVLLVIYLLDNTLIGLGDIEFLYVSSFYLGYQGTIIELFIASIVGIIYIFITNKEEIPFIPFLSIGFILSELISYI